MADPVPQPSSVPPTPVPSPQPTSGQAFDLLAEGVQRQLYKMGWPSLRPLQVKSIRAYLQSDAHLLLMAETAGGKTEAAFLPVLSAISTEPAGSVRALYVGPLKALINDQFGRLEDLCTHLDMPVFRWHGDVPASQKKALVEAPAGVLLITPESLESLLVNRTGHLASLFGGLRAVVIDEVHAFLENERGLHLASLLTRLRRYQTPGEPAFRTLGLSATVGDVATAQRYLSPDRPDAVTVVTDDGGGKEIQFRVHGYLKTDADEEADDSSGTDQDAEQDAVEDEQLRVMSVIAADLVEHCRTRSNLIFANSKGDIEVYADLANELCSKSGLPETFLVHHGSLAKEVREDTEHTMKAGRSMSTICSSTLEMGIDIGAVSMVGQVGAPWSVASLKQRMGRSGRKEGEPRRLRVYVVCESGQNEKDPLSQLPIELLQATAVCELMLQKWVEPPSPAKHDFSTLTHQIISIIAELGAVLAHELYERLCRVGPFRDFQPPLFAQLLRRLGQEDVIEQGPDGKLILGLQGEHLRTRRDFYAAFAGRAEYSIIAGNRMLGTLPIDTVPKLGEHIVFAAKRWQVIDVDPGRLTLHVQPARRRKRPRFTGSPGEVHPRIREEMRRLLVNQTAPVYLDQVSSAALQVAQAVASGRGLAARGIVSLSDMRCLWLTWTGTAAQRTLLAWLTSLGIESTDRQVAIECRIGAKALEERLRAESARPMDSHLLAEQIPVKQFRKYDYVFDEPILNDAIATDRLDVSGATSVVLETIGRNQLTKSEGDPPSALHLG